MDGWGLQCLAASDIGYWNFSFVPFFSFPYPAAYCWEFRDMKRIERGRCEPAFPVSV